MNAATNWTTGEENEVSWETAPLSGDRRRSSSCWIRSRNWAFLLTKSIADRNQLPKSPAHPVATLTRRRVHSVLKGEEGKLWRRGLFVHFVGGVERNSRVNSAQLCVYGARFCVCKISMSVWIMTCLPGDNEEIVSEGITQRWFQVSACEVQWRTV